MFEESKVAEATRQRYVQQYRANLADALEICSDPELLCLERVNFPLIASQVAQLVTDVGVADAVTLLEELVTAVRHGKFRDYDGDQLTPFEELTDGGFA